MAPPTEATLYVAPDKASVPNTLNPIIVRLCQSAIEQRGRFVIALSGGSLPSFLATLPDAFVAAGVDANYQCWNVLLADERCVPASDPDNNMTSIRDKFLSKVPVPADQIYAIDESKLSVSADAVAVAYEAKLKEVVSLSGGMLDLALLGFGPDGHTCSLFPNHPLLSESTRWVAPITDSPKPPPQRITLTLPVLNTMTRSVVLCGAGASKQPILQAVIASATPVAASVNGDDIAQGSSYLIRYTDPPPYPCAMVVPKRIGNDDNDNSNRRSLLWVVDADAFSGVVPT